MTFAQEKGKVVSSVGMVGFRVTVHEKTDPVLVTWLDESIRRASEEEWSSRKE